MLSSIDPKKAGGVLSADPADLTLSLAKGEDGPYVADGFVLGGPPTAPDAGVARSNHSLFPQGKIDPSISAFSKIRRMVVDEIVEPLPVVMVGNVTWYERKAVEERLATINWSELFRKYGLEGVYTLGMM